MPDAGGSTRRPSWFATAAPGRRPGPDSPVEPRLPDVADDSLGHEVADRLPARDPRADVGGRDGECGDAHVADAVVSGNLLLERRDVVAGPGRRAEVSHLEQFGRVFPLEDLEHRVGARDEEQVGAEEL